MAIRRFLAMSAAELSGKGAFPADCAWLGCCFSPYGRGLSNLPQTLPPGALLIVEDSVPVAGHDPHTVARQLAERVAQLDCCGVLLDFQRPDGGETAQMAEALTKELTVPVVVSALYGKDLNGPVSLPPVPCHVSVEDYLHPWEDRRCWLELALEGETIALTPQGAKFTPLLPPFPEAGFSDAGLCCHYDMQLEENRAVFRLWRTKSDLAALEAQAGARNVQATLGLWQELR